MYIYSFDLWLAAHFSISRLFLIGFVCLALILVLSSFFVLKKMGNDERSDSLIFRIGTMAFLINTFLNSILVNLNVINWQFFLLFNFFFTTLISFLLIIKKYYQFLK